MSAGLLYSESSAEIRRRTLEVTFLRETETQRLYGLCLAFIPDADMADDIFLSIQDESDLLRQAARWRLKHGYGPLPTEVAPAALDAAEQEHALHLARRGRLRRRVRSFAMAGGAVVLAMLLLVGWQKAPAVAPQQLVAAIAPSTGLESDPAFSSAPVGQNRVGGLTLTVYQAVGVPGDVTVWWSLSGPDAAAAAKTFSPRFFGNQARAETVLSSGRRDRVYGRSRFELILTSDHPIAFGGEIGERPLWVTAPAPYQPQLRPQTVVRLDGPVTVDGAEWCPPAAERRGLVFQSHSTAGTGPRWFAKNQSVRCQASSAALG